MPPEIVNLLTQAPIVLTFIWFVLEWSKRNQAEQERRDQQFRAFLQEQRESDRAVLKDLVTEIQAIGVHLEEHDGRAREALHILKSRRELTKPRKTPPA